MAKQSVEQIKRLSDGLRGQIEETLKSDASHFEEAEYQLLKFHGTYQQDDRDLRSERRKQKLDKAWSFMVRSKMPGGRISAETVPGPRPARRDPRQQDPAPDHPPGNPVARHPDGRSQGCHRHHQELRPDDPRRLRRRGSANTMGAGGAARRCRPSRCPVADRGTHRGVPAAHHLVQRPVAERGKDRSRRRSRPRSGARRRADLRQGLPAAEVQDRHRRPAAQRRRHLFPGHRAGAPLERYRRRRRRLQHFRRRRGSA